MDPHLYGKYPIAWITKSNKVIEFMKEQKNKEILIADFASGEHDRVPSFFVKIIHEFLDEGVQDTRTTVYSIDLHALRLDSLLGKLEESDLLERTRVVQSNLETMDRSASFRPDLKTLLLQIPEELTWLDRSLLEEERIPDEAFDIGVLNNDVVGYLFEYYTEYSDATVALKQVHRTIKNGGLLVVSNPCLQYIIDNVKILEEIGFEFVEGYDIDFSTKNILEINRRTPPKSMSRLNHYSFLIFSKSSPSRIES
ncbi:MAG: hypothetical protein ACFFF9_10095 [Candidatus Thorarchaeota archaeon]